MSTEQRRLMEFDFLRATEQAALNSLKWVGQGQKESADESACDAIRGMFDHMDIRGEVVIGEGIKDEAPGLFKGEHVGTWADGSPRYDIALDPIDGTTNCSKGLPNSIACIAAALPGDGSDNALQDIPAFYMDKLAYPQAVRKAWIEDPSLPISVDAPIGEVLRITAKILEKEIRDVVVVILDRPRNEQLIEDVRSLGAQLRMISDGDITTALAPALNSSPIDIYAGIGGSPEGVLSAAALRCLGGGMQAKIWPRDEAEKQSLINEGWGDKLDTVFRSRDLAKGEDIFFAATGITESPLLDGLHVKGSTAITHSVLMRDKSKTVRFLQTHHNLETKKIYLRSTEGAANL
ncbi:MAG: class II fructose-bisphosphatase [Limisphaerales bacterium]